MSYEYKEFPLWVEHKDGERKIVHSDEEFKSLGEGWKKPPAFVTPGFGPGRVMIEYPKWIGGVLVHSAEEEEALEPANAPDAGEPNGDDEKAALIELAEERGVKIDKRWSAEKIRAAIEAA